MANTKISNLPAAASLTGSDLMPVVQGGVTKKGTFDQIPFLQAGTGAVARTAQAKMRDVVSVKDFGAVGDGVTDDTAAIQAAINGRNGAYVYFPSGQYVCSSSIDVKGARLVGSGTGNIGSIQTQITFSGTSGFYSSTENNHGFQIEKMQIYGSGAKATNGQILIDFTGQNYPYLEDVRVWNSDTGIKLAKGTTVECNYGKFFRVDANQCTTGVNVTLSTPGASNSHSFYGGRIWDNTLGVFIPLSHTNIAFYGTAFEANDTYAVDSEGFNVSFFGCRFENPGVTNVRIKSGAGAHWFSGNHWSSGFSLNDETAEGVAYTNDQLLSSVAPLSTLGKSTTSPENLLGNSAFIYDRNADGTPEPWIFTFTALGAATCALVTGEIGGSAVQIANPTTAGNNVRLYQQVKVVKGLTYTLSWKAKTSADSWSMRVSSTSSSGTEYANVSNTETEYKWKSVRFTATSNDLWVSFYLAGTAVRTVTVDAVVLTQGVVPANGVNQSSVGEYGGIAQENIGTAGGTWDTAHFTMGNYHLWVDATGDLRIKNGVPASDTDGTVVGTQT